MDNELLFQKKNMMAFIELQQVTKARKEAEAREKEIKEQLVKGMDEFGLVSIDNEYVRISYVRPTEGSPKLDEKTWKAEDPEGYHEVFNKYNKMSGGKKGYVRVDLK